MTVELIALTAGTPRAGSAVSSWQPLPRIPGLYVPSLYRVTYREDGAVSSVTPLEGAPELVTKRIVQDLNQSYFPVKPSSLYGDRTRQGDAGGVSGLYPGCRFCQAGYAYRPVRSKDPALSGGAGDRGL